jgi:hypothetical protein
MARRARLLRSGHHEVALDLALTPHRHRRSPSRISVLQTESVGGDFVNTLLALSPHSCILSLLSYIVLYCHKLPKSESSAASSAALAAVVRRLYSNYMEFAEGKPTINLENALENHANGRQEPLDAEHRYSFFVAGHLQP